MRTLLEENLYQKAVQFKDIIHGKFQNVTKEINEVNSTVTKSATVKCILIIGWKQPMKTSFLSSVQLRFYQFSPNMLQYRESTDLKEINKHIKMDRKFWAGPAQDIWVPWAG